MRKRSKGILRMFSPRRRSCSSGEEQDEQMTWGVHKSPSSCMVQYLGRDWKNLLQKIYEYKKSKHYKFRLEKL
jgi:hypothetical protein